MLWRLVKSVWMSFGSMPMHWSAFIFGYKAPGPRLHHVDTIYKRIHFQSDI